MTPIDLVDFTNSDRKIPSDILGYSLPKATNAPFYKIVGAHALDLALVFYISLIFFTVIRISLQTLMITPGLRRIYSSIPFEGYAWGLFPLVLMTYFFLSYFLNHGQTYAMNKFKIRVQMPHMDYRTSLAWAVFSTISIISCGLTLLTYPMMKVAWGELKKHDYLYMHLTKHRDLVPVSLIETIPLEQELEDFYKAA